MEREGSLPPPSRKKEAQEETALSGQCTPRRIHYVGSLSIYTYVHMCVLRVALCAAIQVAKHGQMLDIVRLCSVVWLVAPKGRSCGFRGQTRSRMKGRQIAGECTPNYSRRFCLLFGLRNRPSIYAGRISFAFRNFLDRPRVVKHFPANSLIWI